MKRPVPWAVVATVVACLASGGCATATDAPRGAAARDDCFDVYAAEPAAQLRGAIERAQAEPGALIEGRLSAGGLDLAVYVRVVERPRGTAVYAHGYMASVASSGPAIEALAERGWNVVALDLPGHGKSGGERHVIDEFSDYSRALALTVAAAKELGRPLALVGHSLGGAAILGFLERCPEAADGAVLVAPLARLRNHAWASLGAWMAGAFTKTLPGGVPARWFSAYRRWGERRWIGSGSATPLLLVLCGEDRVVSFRAARVAAAAVAAVETVELPGIGHWEIDRADADPRLWGAVGGFLDRLAGEKP